MSRRFLLPGLLSLALLSCALLACASSGERTDDPAPGGSTGPDRPAATAPATIPSTPDDADPHISRSPGFPGSIVVLYPRIIPRGRAAELAPWALTAQQELRQLVEDVLPDKQIDLRPAPERTCPQAGCIVPAVGILLASIDTACVAVVTISQPGRSSAQLTKWAGHVRFKESLVPFREPVESFVELKDLVPCDQLPAALQAGSDEVKTALRRAIAP